MLQRDKDTLYDWVNHHGRNHLSKFVRDMWALITTQVSISDAQYEVLQKIYTKT